MQKKYSKLTFFLLGLFLNPVFTFAQDCVAYLPFKKGAELELTNYDKNKQATTKVLHQVVDFKNAGGASVIDVQTKTTDLKKNKEMGISKYQAKCENGAYKFQFGSFVMASNEQMSNLKDFEVQAEGDFIEIPSSPQAGQALQGGQLKIKTLINGTANPMLNQTITVSNRKVEGMEKVTTAAGTFDCVKISEDVEFKTIIKFQVNTVSWYSKEVGLVKSESYRKGKLMGSTELSSIKK
jgi:hypothetical protein